MLNRTELWGLSLSEEAICTAHELFEIQQLNVKANNLHVLTSVSHLNTHTHSSDIRLKIFV